MPLILNGTTGISGVDGSAGTPSYVGADTDTGVLFPAANTLALSTGGTEWVRVDSSGNVGVGTTSPISLLHLSSGNPTLRIQSTGTGFASSVMQNTNSAFLYGVDNAAGNLSGVANGTFFINQNATSMLFATNNSERMRIDSSGNVGIGTSSPSANLQVNGSNIRLQGDNSFYSIASTAGSRYGYLQGTSSGLILTADGATYLRFDTNSTERMRITSAGYVGIGNTTPTQTLDVGGVGGTSPGDLTVKTTSTDAQVVVGRLSGVSADNTTFRVRNRVDANAFLVTTGNRTAQVGTTFGVGDTTPASSGAGITFPATQSASSDANTLDDYEEGSWTPSYTSSGTNPTLTQSGDGRYVKIGRFVFVTGSLFTSATTNKGTGDLRISGLPFTISSDTSNLGASIALSVFWLTNPGAVQSVPNTTRLDLYRNINNTVSPTTDLDTGTFNNVFRFAFSYYASV